MFTSSAVKADGDVTLYTRYLCHEQQRVYLHARTHVLFQFCTLHPNSVNAATLVCL